MINSVEELLIREEGEKLSAYQDSEGYWTIGIGRLIDERKGGHISHDEALYLLKNDINRIAEYLVYYSWFSKLNEVRKAVIISMCFQVGSLKDWPKFRAAMTEGNYHDAAKEMLDSKVAKEIAPLRWNRAASMMLSGEWI